MTLCLLALQKAQSAEANVEPTQTVDAIQSLNISALPAGVPFRIVCITKKSNVSPRKDCADGTTIISTDGAICPNETMITDYEVRVVDKNTPVVINKIDDDDYKIYDVVRQCTYFVK